MWSESEILGRVLRFPSQMRIILIYQLSSNPRIKPQPIQELEDSMKTARTTGVLLTLAALAFLWGCATGHQGQFKIPQSWRSEFGPTLQNVWLGSDTEKAGGSVDRVSLK